MSNVDHELVERFLLHMAELGGSVTRALQAATGEPEFINNAPMLVLCTLDLEGTKRPGDLQQVVGLTSGGTSKLLDRLQEAGLISRSYGVISDDFRGVQIAITPKGRRLVRGATRAFTDHLSEVAVLVKELAGVIDALESGAGPRSHRTSGRG